MVFRPKSANESISHLAIGLSALFIAASMLPGQAPAEDYSDIIVNYNDASTPEREPIRTASVEQPMVQTTTPDDNRTGYGDVSPGNLPSYRFPSTDQPLFAPVEPLYNVSMHSETLKSGLEKYNSASRKSTIRNFYEQRSFRKAWGSGSRLNSDALDAIDVLEEAALEGLNPAEYHIDEIRRAYMDRDFVLLELLLTDNVLRYASHVRDGQYSPGSVDKLWLIKRDARDDILSQLNQAISKRQVESFLRSLPPPHEVYRGLRKQLRIHAELANRGGWPSFPASGSALRPGDRDRQVAQLRARLAVTDGADAYVADPAFFDAALEDSVRQFQVRHGLNDDGIIGPKTREALSVPVHNRVRQIIASLERFRWIPRELGSTNIVVNVPAFRLWYTAAGAQPLTMRTIVGETRKDHQTPSFSNHMKYLVVNPNWNVPNSIASKEISPKVSRNPDYLERGGYSVFDQSGNRIDPSTVDWSLYGRHNPLPYRIVQSRGADGVLGTVKFMFPNRHGIYLHDTQTRHLFKKDFRAFSHGCVRIEKPMELASMILGDMTPEQFQEMINNSSRNRHIDLTQEIPVYLVYMTAWSDEGTAHFYEDLYNRDRELIALDSGKRRV
jgi:L,D-transpeptidase YcbB